MSFSKASTKLFFPNFVLKLVRSNLPPHQAVFYCPPQLTRMDIRQFLQEVYDVSVTDVRTMNYLGSKGKKNGRRIVGHSPAYKKAIVTMKEDFVFPSPPSVKDDNAIKIPPSVGVGRNSANRVRSKIVEQAIERGVNPRHSVGK